MVGGKARKILRRNAKLRGYWAAVIFIGSAYLIARELLRGG